MILQHQFTNSSMLHSASYDTQTKELSVTFVNGREYTYVDVEESTYDELIGSASAGRYFNLIKSGLTVKQ